MLVGGAGATVPSYVRAHFDAKRRIRVASLMLRDDLHRFQDSMDRSLTHGSWFGDPAPRLAGNEELALVAEGLTKWTDWVAVTNAVVSRRLVLDLIAEGEPVQAVTERVWNAFKAIDVARPKLSLIDNGPKDMHGARNRVHVKVWGSGA